MSELNINNYFNKASNMNGSYPPIATVTSARSAGGATLTCDSLAGWATSTPVHFSTFKVNTDGTIDTTTQTDWKGIVVDNTITEMTRLAGAADSGNASGDRVELNPTIGWLDDLVTGLLVSHTQTGALRDSIVTEGKIATGAVTSSKVAAGAISSYDKIGDDVIQARNLAPQIGDFSETEVDTGFTWTGGEKIYKKTIVTGSFSGTGTLEKDHNITNFSFPIAIQGWGLDGGLSEFKTLPYVRGEDMTATGIGVAVTSTKIRIKRNASYNITNSWFTIWYTKTGGN